MGSRILLLLTLLVPRIASSKMRQMSNTEIIRSAEVIAIIDLTRVENLPKNPSRRSPVELHSPRAYYSSLVECVIGKCDKSMVFFDASSPPISEGHRYLVFLKRLAEGTRLGGVNRGESYRLVQDNAVEWREPNHKASWVPIEDFMAKIHKTLEEGPPTTKANEKQ